MTKESKLDFTFPENMSEHEALKKKLEILKKVDFVAGRISLLYQEMIQELGDFRVFWDYLRDRHVADWESKVVFDAIFNAGKRIDRVTKKSQAIRVMLGQLGAEFFGGRNDVIFLERRKK